MVSRYAKPGDYEAVRQVFAEPQAVWGTLQLPFPSAESWRKRLAEPAEGLFKCRQGGKSPKDMRGGDGTGRRRSRIPLQERLLMK